MIMVKTYVMFILFLCLGIASMTGQIKEDIYAGVSKERSFPHPDRLCFDGHSIILNGQREFLYGGAFHYFRCPKELWRNRFETIKAAGCNLIETYIPWNRHEKLKPESLDDFSKIDLSEFHEWLAMAEEYGFYIIVRPGPFICAEYDRGGYPGWLVSMRPVNPQRWMWLRSDDERYQSWASGHWMKYFCQSIRNHQLPYCKPGTGGIIMVQIENEFSHVYFPREAKLNVLRSLTQTCIDNGIEVPLIACETPEISEVRDSLLSKYVVETRNFYPAFDVKKQVSESLKKLRDNQPDAPSMTTELQGGWFPFVWENQTFKIGQDFYVSNLPAIQIQNLTMYCIQNGQTILNYYMLVGGTNLDNTDAKDMQTSYDYGAPIREHGGTGEKYARIKAIGEMLREHGRDLAASITDLSYHFDLDNSSIEAAVRVGQSGDRYIFVRNNNPKQAYSGKIEIMHKKGQWVLPYDLAPFDSRMFFLPDGETKIEKGKWYPEVKNLKQDSKTVVMGKVKFVEEAAEPLPTCWYENQLGESLLDLGIYDNRYVYYSVDFTLNKSQIKEERVLRVTYPYLKAGSLGSGDNGVPDAVSVFTENGIRLEAGKYPGDFRLPVSLLKEGANRFILLYENAGYTKEFVYMEKEGGITNVQILPIVVNERILSSWKFREIFAGCNTEELPEIVTPDKLEWKEIILEGEEAKGVKTHKRGVFYNRLLLTEEDIQKGRTGLHFPQLGDHSFIFVNGELLTEKKSRISPVTFDLKDLVKVGENNLVIVVDNYDIYAEGGITPARLTYNGEIGICPERIGHASAMSCEEGNLLSFGQREKKDALLKWSKISFVLPEDYNISSHCFLTIKAEGNGKLFLNGHPIGRYWKKGMQSDFYLPECWLKKEGLNEICIQMKNDVGNKCIHLAEIRIEN